MDKTRLLASYFFSFSLLCMAAAVSYFSYALIKTLDQAPEVIELVQLALKDIDPVIDEIENVSGLIPSIVTEVGLVREQVPPILVEVQALRLQLPAVLLEVEQSRKAIPSLLAEIEQLRQSIPPVLEEVARVREQIPAIVDESQGYRELIPDVLAEVEATRKMVDPTMARAEKLLADASEVGKHAGEGAVTGFFTGLIKAPFEMVSAAKTSVFARFKELNSQDVELLTAAAKEVINSGEVSASKTWSNSQSGASGKITLQKEYQQGGQLCRVISVEGRTAKKGLQLEEYTLCQEDGGGWAIQE